MQDSKNLANQPPPLPRPKRLSDVGSSATGNTSPSEPEGLPLSTSMKGLPPTGTSGHDLRTAAHAACAAALAIVLFLACIALLPYFGVKRLFDRP